MIIDADGRGIRGGGRGRKTRITSIPNMQGSGYAAFEEAQGGGLTSIPVECFKFTIGASISRYTSADRSITLTELDSGTYAPSVIDRSEMDFTQEDTAENITVQMPRMDPIAQLYVASHPVAPMALTIYRKHRLDPEEIIIFVGQVLSVSFDGPEATLVCAPVSQAFRRRVPSLAFQSQCAWALYGSGCGLNKALFKDSGTVSAVSGSTVGAAIFATRPDGWFNNGWAELATGARRFIINHVGSTITLQSPFNGLTPGTGIDAFAGCDRSEPTCETKFNNLVHHLGFPRIPTRNPYEGSIV